MASAQGASNIWPYYATQNVQRAARTPVKELGKDEFLQLLMKQMQNQDPMQPVQNAEFIAQMAQFSSLEQMLNVANEMKALRQSAGLAAGLIGKEVGWIEASTDGSGVQRSGVVDSIVLRNGVQYVRIGVKEVPVDELISIADPAEPQPPAGEGNE